MLYLRCCNEVFLFRVCSLNEWVIATENRMHKFIYLYIFFFFIIFHVQKKHSKKWETECFWHAKLSLLHANPVFVAFYIVKYLLKSFLFIHFNFVKVKCCYVMMSSSIHDVDMQWLLWVFLFSTSNLPNVSFCILRWIFLPRIK